VRKPLGPLVAALTNCRYLSLPFIGAKWHHQGYWALLGLLTLWPVALLYVRTVHCTCRSE
jgi:hypothetical protein